MSQADFVGRLVDGLARGGVETAILSPGYRNAPIALALRAHPRIRTVVLVDERAAGFYALGLSRATGAPVVLSCTSGSALANYLPAIVEAHSDRIPLVVLSADRPPELKRAGAPQTMAQRQIFAEYVVWEDELAEPPALDGDLPRSPWDARVAVAIAAAIAEEGGPVHLNLPLRKPLIPEALPCPAAAPPRLIRGRKTLGPAQLRTIVDTFAGAERPVIVAGPMIRAAAGEATALGDAIAGLAQRSGWPMIADLLASCRPCGAQVGDLIARGDGPQADAILWFCDAPISAALLRWMGRCCGPVVRVSAGGSWRDPSFCTGVAIDADPTSVADSLTLPPASSAWRETWEGAIAAARARLADAAAGELGPWGGPTLAAAIAAWPGAWIHVANSTAIRDVDTFATLRPDQRALCNRGVNGIDGTIATAAGEAAGLGQPLLVILGDLALAHDLGALVHIPGASIVILAVNNGGGQIFRQLPLRDHPAFEELFVTETPIDLAAIAAATGWAYEAVAATPALPTTRAADELDNDGTKAREVDLAAALDRAYARGRTILELRLDAGAAHAARQAFWSAPR